MQETLSYPLQTACQTCEHLADPCLHFIGQMYFFAFPNCIFFVLSTVFSDCCQNWEHLAIPWPHFIGLARPCLVCCFYGRQRQRPRNAKSLRPTSFSNISNDTTRNAVCVHQIIAHIHTLRQILFNECNLDDWSTLEELAIELAQF